MLVTKAPASPEHAEERGGTFRKFLYVQEASGKVLKENTISGVGKIPKSTPANLKRSVQSQTKTAGDFKLYLSANS